MKAFITEESGLITPLPVVEVSYQRLVEHIDVSSLAGYRSRVPIRTRTEIELLFVGENKRIHFPPLGILNFMYGIQSYTLRYHLTDVTLYPNALTQIVSLVGVGDLLEGEHTPKLYQVRYDLGDGTYRELYAHENEKETIIERHYNRKNLWL